MIKINLLPPELQIQKKKKAVRAAAAAPAPAPASLSVGIKKLPLKWIAVGAGACFFAFTVWMDIDYLGKKQKKKQLEADWQVKQPQINVLRSLEDLVNTKLAPERDFLKTQVLSNDPVTQLLQAMNDALPDGVWLTQFALNNTGKERSFSLQGQAMNTDNMTSIEQIEIYLQKLKDAVTGAQFSYSTGKNSAAGSLSTTAFQAEFHWSVS